MIYGNVAVYCDPYRSVREAPTKQCETEAAKNFPRSHLGAKAKRIGGRVAYEASLIQRDGKRARTRLSGFWGAGSGAEDVKMIKHARKDLESVQAPMPKHTI